ncbi:MAG TPA: hypothetical protein VF188_10275 [Longimicrobiales bacterium]
MRVRSAIALATLAALGCTPRAGGAARCAAPQQTGTLPPEVGESSGVAVSRRHTGILWTHNDSGGDPVIFAVDSTGHLSGAIRVRGAENVDWEDAALGPCPTGDCLYLADTGDNRLRRDDAAIYRIAEPAPGDSVATAERFPIRYPDAPHDAEALFVLPDGGVFLVTKGHDAPVAVYRYPQPLRRDEAVVLERVQTLTDGPVALSKQITGAAAAPDGRWVALRTYTDVSIHPVRRGRLETAAFRLDIQTLGEPQGEAIGIAPDGSIILTSEAGPANLAAVIARIVCRGEE